LHNPNVLDTCAEMLCNYLRKGRFKALTMRGDPERGRHRARGVHQNFRCLGSGIYWHARRYEDRQKVKCRLMGRRAAALEQPGCATDERTGAD
jgi:hypothetical protein